MRWIIRTVMAVSLLLTACAPVTGAAPVEDSVATVPSPTTTSVPPPAATVATTTAPPAPVPPLLPGDYAAVAFGAWRSGDTDLLARLTTDLAYRLLVDRPPTDADRWNFTACRAVLGNTYCAWTGTSDVLSLRVDNDAADNGLPAVIDVRFTSTG